MLVAVHDQDDDPTSPSRLMPEGKVMFAVTGPVAAVPGSDTVTVTSAVTPRLSKPFTWTETLSLAVAETVGLGDGLGDPGGEVRGPPVGDGLPDGLGEPLLAVAGVAGVLGVRERPGPAIGRFPGPGW